MIAAVIKQWVPVGVFVRYFSGGGVKPLLRAVGVGAMLPICSCGVIPIGVGAFKSGAPRGTTLSFITSGPTISPVAVLLCLSLLGPGLTLGIALTSLSAALLMGFVGNRILGGAEEEALRERRVREGAKEGESLPSATGRTAWDKVRGAAKWAFWDLGTDISVDLLIGLSLAAGILAVLPEGWIATWLGQQKLSTILYVIVVGIPLYTCTVPSIPVVHSLLLMGMSPGAAVAYMISGPATNLGEINVLRRNLGGRTAAVFVGGLVLAALAGGLLVDFVVFPAANATNAFVGSHAVAASCCVAPMFAGGDRIEKLTGALLATPAWHWPFVAILAAALLIGVARRAAGALARLRGTGASVPAGARP
jgi:uncharacterized membrane protein YraQ (UPF0718 family)